MKNIIYQKKSQVFEKIVNRSGKFFRVQFVILEREGKFRGKIIACDEIQTIRTTNEIRKYEQRIGRSYSPFRKGSTRVGEGEGFYLPVSKTICGILDKGLKINDFYISPYFDCLEFLTCIKIRAPSLNNL